MAIKRFRAGGKGVFVCRACKRGTRATASDHEQLDLCEDCFELAGIENALSDSSDKKKVVLEYKDEVFRRLKYIAKRGGKLDCWRDLIMDMEVKGL